MIGELDAVADETLVHTVYPIPGPSVLKVKVLDVDPEIVVVLVTLPTVVVTVCP